MSEVLCPFGILWASELDWSKVRISFINPLRKLTELSLKVKCAESIRFLNQAFNEINGNELQADLTGLDAFH